MATYTNPWENKSTPWKTKAAFHSWLRGVLRRGWNTYPVKTAFIKNNRYQIDNPNPKGRKSTVWGGKCSCCSKEYVASQLQVDHKVMAGSLNSPADYETFIKGLFFIQESDLQYVCKDCHAIITYAEKNGVTFQEASARKREILVAKKSVVELKKALATKNIPTDKCKKNELVQLYIKHLM